MKSTLDSGVNSKLRQSNSKVNSYSKQSKKFYRKSVFWFMLPSLIMFVLLAIYPTLQALWTSFLNYNLTNPLEKEFIFLNNYLQLLTSLRFWQALGRSLLFVVTSVGVSFVIGLFIAVLLSKINKLQNFFQIILLIPMVISATVAAYNFKFMYNFNFGIINHMLAYVGLERINFLGNPSTALWSTVAIDIWQWTPLVILILLAGLQTLPKDPYEAALIDGAGPLQTFFSLTLPMLRSFIIIVVLIRLMDALKVYETIYLVTESGPGNSSETLNTYLATVGFNWFEMGLAAAIGFVALNLTAVLSFVLVKYSNIFETK